MISMICKTTTNADNLEMPKQQQERNSGQSARQNMNTITDSAKAARGWSYNQPNEPLNALRSWFGHLDLTFGRLAGALASSTR